jgi:signal transduction histidine kinase
MNNLTIKIRLIVSALVITLILIIYAIFSISNISKSQNGFDIYKETAKTSLILSKIQANMLMVRINVKDYIKTFSQKDIKEFNLYYKRTLDNIQEAKKVISSYNNIKLDIETIENKLTIYKTNFEYVIKYVNHRNNVVKNNLDINGKRIEQLLTTVMNSAQKDNDLIASLQTAKGIRTLLLARLYTAKFLITNSQTDLNRAQSEFFILQKELYTIKDEIQDKTRTKQLMEAVTLINKYIIGVNEIRSIILQRNNIIENKLNVLGPEIANLAEELKVSLKLNQDLLGTEVSNSNQSIYNSTIIVSTIIILLTTLLFYLIFSSTIKSLDIFQKGLLNFFQYLNKETKSVENINITSNDEIGQMASIINENIEKTKEILQAETLLTQQTTEILNTQPNIIILSDGIELILSNNALFDFLNINSLEEFKKDHQCICELFIEEEGFFTAKKDENWIQQLYLSHQLFHVKMLSADGQYFIFQVDVGQLKSNKNYVVTFSDITLTQHQSLELQKNQKLIYEQAKLASMGEMMGNIAHQWRQPLSVISSSATALPLYHEQGMLDEQMLEKTSNIINEHAQYLSKTIDDFTNYVKGDKEKTKFELKYVIDSALTITKASLNNNKITLINNIQDNVILDGYENALSQALINIINNAKDAIVHNNQKSKVIIVSTKVEGKNLHLQIKDSGGGIDEFIIDKIFEPYFTTKHQSQGTGLGLSMAYKIIVNGMNGKIDISNVSFKHEDQECTGLLIDIIFEI